MKFAKATFRTTLLLVLCFLCVKCKKDTLPATLTKTPNYALSEETLATKAPIQVNSTMTLELNPFTTRSKPIVLDGVSGKVINQLQIAGGSTPCIELLNCSDITIQNSILYGSTVEGIVLYNCKNVTIINCFIFKVSSGVYATESTGISVTSNQFLNMQGPDPGGNFVQFDNVNGSGNIINNNICENIYGQSNPYDEISIYESNGTPDSPIEISGNWLRGGGPSDYSAGIQLGDDGGSYQVAENNTLVNTGSTGIAVSTGTNIQVLNNNIYSSSFSFSNIGLDVWNEYASSCALITVSGNNIKWFNSLNQENDKWNGGGCGKITGWADNTTKANIDASTLPAQIITKLFPK